MPSSHFAAFIDEFAAAGPVSVDPEQVLAVLSLLPHRARSAVFAIASDTC